MGTQDILAGSSSDRNVPFNRYKRMKFMAIPSPKSGEGKKCQISLYWFCLGKLSAQFE